jgi:hypothetical protein
MTPDEQAFFKALKTVGFRCRRMLEAEAVVSRTRILANEAEIKMTRTSGPARVAVHEEYRAARQALRDAEQARWKARHEFAHAMVAWESLNAQRDPPPKQIWMP